LESNESNDLKDQTLTLSRLRRAAAAGWRQVHRRVAAACLAFSVEITRGAILDLSHGWIRRLRRRLDSGKETYESPPVATARRRSLLRLLL
jgi:hypothetical protein